MEEVRREASTAGKLEGHAGLRREIEELERERDAAMSEAKAARSEAKASRDERRRAREALGGDRDHERLQTEAA